MVSELRCSRVAQNCCMRSCHDAGPYQLFAKRGSSDHDALEGCRLQELIAQMSSYMAIIMGHPASRHSC